MHNRPAMRLGKSLTRIFRGFGTLAVFAAVVSTAGCGGTDDRPAKWGYIYPAIIEPNCATASCHSKFTARAGVDLGNIVDGYDTLLMRHFVIPSNTVDSGLLYLLRAQGARRMPPDFPLPTVDVDLIEEWIMGGAMDN